MRAAVRAQMSWPGALLTPAAARGRNRHGGRGHGAHDGLNHHGSSSVPHGDWLRLPGRELLFSSSEAWCPGCWRNLTPCPTVIATSVRHLLASWSRARQEPVHAVRAFQGISGSCPWVSGRGAGISTSRLPAGSAVPSPRVRAASGACSSAGSAQDVASTRTAWVGPQIVSST